jgi:hypothetical protein
VVGFVVVAAVAVVAVAVMQHAMGKRE